MNYRIYPGVVEAIQAEKEKDLKPKRLELGKKAHQELSEELDEEEPPELYLPGIFDVDVEVRDDTEGWKLISERPGRRDVSIEHGEEYNG